MKIKQLSIGALVGVLSLVVVAQPVMAATTTVVVTPTDTQGWSTADTRTNGDVDFVADADTLFGEGALSLKTGDGTPSPSQDKAQYMHAANTPLSSVTDLSYATKQVTASFVDGLPSYQLVIDADGTVGDNVGFTTLVYEPYQQSGATVTPNTWQSWDVDAGSFWSSRNVASENANGGLIAGGGGAPFYSLADVKAKYPNAVVVGFGVNVGSNNPNWDTRADGVVFNDKTYDFELVAPQPVKPTTKEQCKNNGWQNFQTEYKNQGQCVAAVVSSDNSKHNR